MSKFDVDVDDFPELVEPLIDLPISRPWKGYGSAIFFELGKLTPQLTSYGKRRKAYFKGQAGISIYWDWRVGNGTRVIFGSSDSGPEIADGMKELQNLTISNITLDKELLEITVRFSNGNFLKSMTMTKGYPQWSIRLSDEKYLGVKNGQLSGDPTLDEISDEESIASDISEKTVKRWGILTEIGENIYAAIANILSESMVSLIFWTMECAYPNRVLSMAMR